MSWEADDNGPYLHEITGRGVWKRKLSDGFDSYGKSHLTVDGDAEDFIGLALHTKYMIDGHPPVDPCPGVLTFRAGLRLGVLMLDVAIHFKAGLKIGARSVAAKSTAHYKAGARAGAAFLQRLKRAQSVKAGLRLGAGIQVASDNHKECLAGLRLGAVIGLQGPLPPTYNAGIFIGATVATDFVMSQSFNAGVQLAALPVLTSHQVHYAACGVQLGVNIQVVSTNHFSFNAGLQLGSRMSAYTASHFEFNAAAKLGANSLVVTTAILSFNAGLQLGTVMEEWSSSHFTFNAGLQLGTKIEAHVFTEHLKAGLQLGIWSFAATTDDDPPVIIPGGVWLWSFYTLHAGLKANAVETDTLGNFVHMKAGLQLGGTLVVVPRGNYCEDAIPIQIGDTISGQVRLTRRIWYRFTTAGNGIMHTEFVQGAGPPVAIIMETANACGGNASGTTTTGFNGCLEWDMTGKAFVWIIISQPSEVNQLSDWTFTFGDGVC